MFSSLIQNTNLLQQFNRISDQETIISLINEHGLAGFTSSTQFHSDSDKKKNAYFNLYIKATLAELIAIFNPTKEKPIIPLKGASLLYTIYADQPEFRKMSDLDIFIPNQDITSVKRELIAHGFSFEPAKSWFPNSHKYLFFRKSNAFDLTLEVHTKLYYHADYNPIIVTRDNFHFLSLEDELLFLCYHLAEQHAFLKIFWLIDIFLFIKRFASNINWVEVKTTAQNLGVERSLNSCLYACHRHLNLEEIGTPIELTANAKKLITENTLMTPLNHLILHSRLKWFLKDKRAFRYYFNRFIPKTYNNI